MKIMIYAQELLSVVLTPFVLWLSLPDCAPAIVDFFREFSIHVDSLGYVCSFAVFDFKRHGNVKVSLDLVLALFSSVGTVPFPWLPLSLVTITTPRSMISVDLWGTRGTCIDGLHGNRYIDGRDGPLNAIGPVKAFSLTCFLSCLVWRANGSKRRTPDVERGQDGEEFSQL